VFYEDGKTYLDVDVTVQLLSFSYEGSYRVLIEEPVRTYGTKVYFRLYPGKNLRVNKGMSGVSGILSGGISRRSL
jgi:hypothetical protein